VNRHPALTDADALATLLDRWVEAGWLRPIDRAVAGFLDARASTSPLATLGAVLASHQGGGGHVCLDLAEVLAQPDFTLRMPPADPLSRRTAETDTPAAVLAGVDAGTWREALAAHPAVARLDWGEDGATADGRPLVLVTGDRPQLYLRRYWQVEGRVADGLARRHAANPPLPSAVRGVLDALFPPSPDRSATDWQKVACALAARQPFSIITGGPGTGKTTTVVRLLAALTSLHLGEHAGDRPPRVALCAPTGKAAARLSESIGDKVREIASIETGPGPGHWRAVAAHLPEDVHTIHRLIGTRPLAARPRHHRDNPLDLDVLVVDEASMVGVELMSQLVDALPDTCRLVMLGDKDQLASVEAGAVLGELCQDVEHAVFPAPLRTELESGSGQPLPSDPGAPADPIHARIATLRLSYRFGQDSAIGRLARSVNRGDATEATEALGGGPTPALRDSHLEWLLDDPDEMPPGVFARRVIEGLRPWLARIEARPAGYDPASPEDEEAVAELFARHSAFQVLCALRRGEAGVEGLNARIHAWLQAEGLLAPSGAGSRHAAWYAGRPVMVTRNDPQLGLANGDMGLTLPVRLDDGQLGLRVVFPAEAGSARRFRWISPTRLPEAETAFALTVHKSQGSEFTDVAMVMPERPNPILSRELLYTAITRARRRFVLVSPQRADSARPEGPTQVLATAVGSQTRRSGNLRRRLLPRLDRDDDRGGVRSDEGLV